MLNEKLYDCEKKYKKWSIKFFNKIIINKMSKYFTYIIVYVYGKNKIILKLVR